MSGPAVYLMKLKILNIVHSVTQNNGSVSVRAVYLLINSAIELSYLIHPLNSSKLCTVNPVSWSTKPALAGTVWLPGAW
jgi:hypothetical protein